MGRSQNEVPYRLVSGESRMNSPSFPLKLKPMVSIVCPAFNEESVLPLFHEALIAARSRSNPFVDWEIIYVDDGSSDGTWCVLADLVATTSGCKAIRLERNEGQQHAMTAGLDSAAGTAMITMDADLQHPPELIHELIYEWLDGAEVVQTVRLEDPSLPMIKRFGSRWFGNIMGWFTGLDVKPGMADYRLIDRGTVDCLQKMNDSPRMLRAAVASLKRRTKYIEYAPRNRAAGVSKYDFKKMFVLALKGFWTYGNWSVTGRASAMVLALVPNIGLLMAFASDRAGIAPDGWTIFLTVLVNLLAAWICWLIRNREVLVGLKPPPKRYQVGEIISHETCKGKQPIKTLLEECEALTCTVHQNH